MHLDYYTNITRNPGHVKRKEAEGGGRCRPRRDSETLLFRIVGNEPPDGLVRVGQQPAVFPGELAAVAAEVGPLGHQIGLALLQAQVLVENVASPVEQDVELALIQREGKEVGEQRGVLYVELVAVLVAAGAGKGDQGVPQRTISLKQSITPHW